VILVFSPIYVDIDHISSPKKPNLGKRMHTEAKFDLKNTWQMHISTYLTILSWQKMAKSGSKRPWSVILVFSPFYVDIDHISSPKKPILGQKMHTEAKFDLRNVWQMHISTDLTYIVLTKDGQKWLKTALKRDFGVFAF
jgi:hypothetical protein